MTLAIIALFAGALSVLAPCVLPVLPVILGGSLADRRRYIPLIIVGSTVLSIILFTILLKASTALLGIDPSVWTWISGLIIGLYGVTLVFPDLRDHARTSIRLDRANQLASHAHRRSGIRSHILLGASLGPIFASCSPTYALLLSLIFPQSFALGVLYTLLYAVGFGILLLSISYGGRVLIQRLSGLTNPHGWFKKILGRLLIITGVLIVSGLMKQIEIMALDAGRYGAQHFENQLLESLDDTSS